MAGKAARGEFFHLQSGFIPTFPGISRLRGFPAPEEIPAPKFPLFPAHLCSHSQRFPAPHSKVFSPFGKPRKAGILHPPPPQLPRFSLESRSRELLRDFPPPQPGSEAAGNDGKFPPGNVFPVLESSRLRFPGIPRCRGIVREKPGKNPGKNPRKNLGKIPGKNWEKSREKSQEKSRFSRIIPEGDTKGNGGSRDQPRGLGQA